MRTLSRSAMATTSKLLLGDFRPLPESVMQDGREWMIRPGTRGILRILRMLEDDEVAANHKTALLVRWFFVEDVPPDPVGAFREFITMGDGQEDGRDDLPRDFDYEQDAAEIISSFQQLYGLDLLGADGGMHWWRFRALLSGCFCVDCALCCKIRLRKADPSKADEATKEAIERVQLDNKDSAEERRMAALIGERLKSGMPINDLI